MLFGPFLWLRLQFSNHLYYDSVVFGAWQVTRQGFITGSNRVRHTVRPREDTGLNNLTGSIHYDGGSSKGVTLGSNVVDFVSLLIRYWSWRVGLCGQCLLVVLSWTTVGILVHRGGLLSRGVDETGFETESVINHPCNTKRMGVGVTSVQPGIVLVPLGTKVQGQVTSLVGVRYNHVRTVWSWLCKYRD